MRNGRAPFPLGTFVKRPPGRVVTVTMRRGYPGEPRNPSRRIGGSTSHSKCLSGKIDGKGKLSNRRRSHNRTLVFGCVEGSRRLAPEADQHTRPRRGDLPSRRTTYLG